MGKSELEKALKHYKIVKPNTPFYEWCKLKGYVSKFSIQEITEARKISEQMEINLMK